MLFGHLCWSWQVMLFSLSNLLGVIAFLVAFLAHKRYGVAKLRLVSNLALVATVCVGFALLIGIANVTCGLEELRVPGDIIAVAASGIALFIFGFTALHCDEIRFGEQPAKNARFLVPHLTVSTVTGMACLAITCITVFVGVL